MVKTRYRKKIRKTLAAIMSVSMIMSSVSFTALAETTSVASDSNAEVSVTVNGPNTTVDANGVKITVTETVKESKETTADGVVIDSEKKETETIKESSNGTGGSTTTNDISGEWKETATEPTETTNSQKNDTVSVTSGNENKTDTVITDDQNRVIEESGTVNGSETTTETDTTVHQYTEDRDALENDDYIDGTPKTTVDENGEWSESKVTEEKETISTTIDSVYAGDVTVNLTPGTEGSASKEVDENQVYEEHIAEGRPENSYEPGTPSTEDILDDSTGEKVGTKTTTVDVNTKVEDIKNADKEVVGYTVTETTTTTVVTEISNTVTGDSETANITSPTTTFDPVTTTEVVLPQKPVGSETVNADGSKSVTTVAEIKAEINGVETVVGYQTTTEVFDAKGNRISKENESVWGKKTTTVTTKETLSTATTTTEYITTETTTTDITEGTTVNGVWVTSTPRQVSASMSQVTVGKNDGDNELKALNIDTATLLANLNTNDLFNPKDHVADKEINGEVFHYVGHLVGSDYLVYRKQGNSSAHTDVYIYVLKDKDGNEFYGYCADVATHANKGTLYEIANLEDVDYYQNNKDGQAEAHIRAIAMNGFWGTASGTGSLDAVKQLLKKEGYADWNTLTEGQALAATQAAMWKYGNNGNASPTNEDDVSYKMFSGTVIDGSQADKNIQKLYKVLTSMTVPADTSTNILDVKDVISASITVGERVADHANNSDNNDANDVYSSEIGFTIALVPDSKDSMKAVITQNGNVVGSVNLTAANGTTDKKGNTTYRIEGIELQEGIAINLNIEGTQNLKQGVYIYTAIEGVDKSQTFVGVAEGTHKVDLDVNLTFNVTDETAEKHVSSEASERTKQNHYETETVDTEINEEVVATVEVTSVTVTETGSAWSSEYKNTYTYKPENTNDNTDPNGGGNNDPSGGGNNDPEYNYNIVTLSDPGVPLGSAPANIDVLGEYEILDEDVPLGNMVLNVLPMTGDVSALWMILSALSGLGLAAVSLTEKRRKEDE